MKAPQFRITITEPPPSPDDEAKYIALLWRLTEIGRPLAAREDALIVQVGQALAAGDEARLLLLCRQLCRL